MTINKFFSKKTFLRGQQAYVQMSVFRVTGNPRVVIGSSRELKCQIVEIQGVPSQMLFKESIYLSFCVQYCTSENSFEKVVDCSFCMQKCRTAQ